MVVPTVLPFIILLQRIEFNRAIDGIGIMETKEVLP